MIDIGHRISSSCSAPSLPKSVCHAGGVWAVYIPRKFQLVLLLMSVVPLLRRHETLTYALPTETPLFPLPVYVIVQPYFHFVWAPPNFSSLAFATSFLHSSHPPLSLCCSASINHRSVSLLYALQAAALIDLSTENVRSELGACVRACDSSSNLNPTPLDSSRSSPEFA